MTARTRDESNNRVKVIVGLSHPAVIPIFTGGSASACLLGTLTAGSAGGEGG